MRKTFEELGALFLQKRLAKTKSRELSTSSYRADEIRWRKLLPAFAGRLVVDVTFADVENFLDSLILQGRSAATRNRYRALLHTFYEFLKRLGIVKENPVATVRALSEKLKSREVSFWRTQREVDAYIAGMARAAPEFGIAAAFLCLGGCRIAEALSVRWEDIEWDSDFVWIRRILERHTGEIRERTKSQRAGGSYPMIMVKRLRTALLRWKMKATHFRPRDVVVHRLPDGNGVTYDQYRKVHQRVIAEAKLPSIRIHDLRRTFAVLADRLGLSRQDISLLLGHETIHTVAAYLPPDRSYTFEKAQRLGLGNSTKPRALRRP